MKYIISILALFLLLVLQSGILSQLGLGAVGNLMLLFTITGVILLDVRESLIIAIIAGFMLDLASGSRDGTLVISFLACYGFTYSFIYKFVPRDPNRLILITCVAVNTIIFALAFVFTNKLLVVLRLDQAVDWRYVLGNKLLLDMIVNIIFAYPVFYIYRISKDSKANFIFRRFII